MIGRAMETWEDDQLRRVVDAPIEAWDYGTYRNRRSDDGCPRCLVGHALNLLPDDGQNYHDDGWFMVSFRFIWLCQRKGQPHAIALVKARALRILLQRHPMEPVAPALTEAVG